MYIYIHIYIYIYVYIMWPSACVKWTNARTCPSTCTHYWPAPCSRPCTCYTAVFIERLGEQSMSVMSRYSSTPNNRPKPSYWQPGAVSACVTCTMLYRASATACTFCVVRQHAWCLAPLSPHHHHHRRHHHHHHMDDADTRC